MQGVVSLQAWTALVAKQVLSIIIRGLQAPPALDLLWVVPPLEAALEVALTQIEHKA